MNRHGIEKIAIFLGGMRCGSTATLDYMRQHPEACIHGTKDPHFFSGNDNWAKGWDWYLSGWTHYDPTRHRIAFESSTHYVKAPIYPKTAERMASSDFDMRLVYGVRGPIERVESHFVHNAGKGYLDPSDPEDRQKLLEFAVNVSNYEFQLARFEAHFPIEAIHIQVLSDLLAQPVDTMRATFAFLGIDDAVEVERIPRRPRRFKNDISHVALTEEERQFACSALREPTARFEKRFGIHLWDGDE